MIIILYYIVSLGKVTKIQLFIIIKSSNRQSLWSSPLKNHYCLPKTPKIYKYIGISLYKRSYIYIYVSYMPVVDPYLTKIVYNFFLNYKVQ